jgi:hypothetical protein
MSHKKKGFLKNIFKKMCTQRGVKKKMFSQKTLASSLLSNKDGKKENKNSEDTQGHVEGPTRDTFCLNNSGADSAEYLKKKEK